MERERRTLEDLEPALRALLGWLRAEKLKFVIIGGVAAGLLGRPRTTQDVDAIIWLPRGRLESFFESAGPRGFEPRIDDALEFARRSLVFQLRHVPTQVPVDLSRGGVPFEEEVIDNATIVRAVGLEIPVPRPDDLFIMKAVAFRARDRVDLADLVDAHPNLDRKRILEQVALFAREIDAPDRVQKVRELLGD